MPIVSYNSLLDSLSLPVVITVTIVTIVHHPLVMHFKYNKLKRLTVIGQINWNMTHE